ncbi:MAG: hypothetical protein K6347_00035 [Campylobacterales bacterium]
MIDFYMGNLVTIGFFISLIFSVLTMTDPFDILIATIMITVVFYIIGLFTSSLLIRYTDMKEVYDLRRDQLENALDNFVDIIERKEKKIDEFVHFIRELEEEEVNIVQKRREAEMKAER